MKIIFYLQYVNSLHTRYSTSFTSGNVDPSNLDQVESLFSLDKPSIDTYAIRLFKLQGLASNDEHQGNENSENVQETLPNTDDGEQDPIDDNNEFCLPL